jgi:pyruvate,water dikinase
MSFVIPLACAIVAEKGGSLIHGAPIVREYGLPWVTGVSRAKALLRTGEKVVVDGCTGIVTRAA